MVLALWVVGGLAAKTAWSEEFFIGAWGGPHLSEGEFNKYARAHFNVVLDYPYEEDNVNSLLALAQKTNLKVILNLKHRFLKDLAHGEQAPMLLADAVDQRRDLPEVVGYMLYDEPQTPAEAQLLGQLATHISKNLRNDQKLWVNFIGSPPYATWPDQFLGLYPAGVISTTNIHPVRIGFAFWDQFFASIQRISDSAKKGGAPFWGIVQSAAWEEKRQPTPQEIQLQCLSSLADGAKGVWYYTYIVPHHSRTIRSAILDKDDGETPLYQAVTEINQNALIFAHALSASRFAGVFHLQNTQKSLPVKDQQEAISLQGNNLLVGTFARADGGLGVLIVNKQVEENADDKAASAVLDVEKARVSLAEVDETSGEVRLLNNASGKYQLAIKPAAARLLIVSPRS